MSKEHWHIFHRDSELTAVTYKEVFSCEEDATEYLWDKYEKEPSFQHHQFYGVFLCPKNNHCPNM